MGRLTTIIRKGASYENGVFFTGFYALLKKGAVFFPTFKKGGVQDIGTYFAKISV